MSMSIRTAFARLRALFQRTRLERDLDDEVEAHLDLLAGDYARRGLSPADARAAARRAFGGVEQMKEQYRDRRSLPVIETTMADLRYAVRMLRRSPAFTLVAVLSLALGIGANVAVFTVINAVTLRTLPVPHPRDLVVVDSHYRNEPGRISFPLYRDLRARQQVFTDMFATAGETPLRLTIPAARRAGVAAHATASRATLDGATAPHAAAIPGAAPTSTSASTGAGVDGSATAAITNSLGGDAVSIDNVRVSFVTASYFGVLGVQSALGRFYTEDEDRLPDSAESLGTVAVLSDGFWERQFGRDPGVLDRTVIVNRTACRVIGIAPRGFTGEALGGTPDLWVPLVASSSASALDNRRGSLGDYMARLKPGVTRQQAEAQLTVLFQQLIAAEQPLVPRMAGDGPRQAAEEFRIALQPGATGIDYGMRRTLTTPLAIIMAIVLLVLLIACANVANLLLARAATRRREITVRLAVGCARGRLVRQLLTESVLLSLLGALGGLALAWWGGPGLLHLLDAAPIAPAVDLTPDARVFAFTVAIVLATGIGFGLVPALRARDVNLAPALNDRTRGTSRRLSQRLSRTLVIAQVALSLLLLIGAGLLVRSLRNLRAVDLGFRPEQVSIVELGHGLPPLQPGPDGEAARAALLTTIERQVLARIVQIPGVQSASLSRQLLFSANDIGARFLIRDGTQAAGAPVNARFNVVSAGYFDTIGMTLAAGRAIDTRDSSRAPAVAVINEAMARRYFPSGDAIGRRLEMQLPGNKERAAITTGRPIAIVGIVQDAKYNSIRQEAQPMCYVSLEQFPGSLRSLEIRSTLPAAALAAPVRQALLDVSRDIMIRRTVTLAAQVDHTLAPERLITGLCTFFGALALLLASIGLYGVMAYGVAQRTSEIGIRMALGASRLRVLVMVLRHSLIVVIAGIALGLPLAWLATRALAGFLYGLSPTDPATIAIATLTLVSVAAIAAWIPARRATRVEPDDRAALRIAQWPACPISSIVCAAPVSASWRCVAAAGSIAISTMRCRPISICWPATTSVAA